MKEFDLLKAIYAASKNLDPVITIGPGDDMGEVRTDHDRLLCAVDQLIVGRHVLSTTSPQIIGRKAIARCFSDIAAMAGSPIASLMTACISSNADEQWALSIFEGAQKVAREWGGPLMGGDIAMHDESTSVFTVTALATPPSSGAIRRVGSSEHDFLCVTGKLGNANEEHHLTFTPRIHEAQDLLKELEDDLHAMIDISDGLGQDASHLASELLQIQIDTTALPLRGGASIEQALCDGEDYELLFTSSRIPSNELVSVIGRVAQRPKEAPAVIDEHGNDLSSMGWEHSCTQ